MFICVCVCVSVCLSVCLCVCLCLSIYLSVWLCFCVYICMCVHIYIYACRCMFVSIVRSLCLYDLISPSCCNAEGRGTTRGEDKLYCRYSGHKSHQTPILPEDENVIKANAVNFSYSCLNFLNVLYIIITSFLVWEYQNGTLCKLAKLIGSLRWAVSDSVVWYSFFSYSFQFYTLLKIIIILRIS